MVKLAENTLYKRYSYKLKGTPIHATLEFIRLVTNSSNLIMVKLQYQSILVQGKKDGIVPYATAQFIYDEIGSLKKEIVYSEIRETPYLL